MNAGVVYHGIVVAETRPVKAQRASGGRGTAEDHYAVSEASLERLIAQAPGLPLRIEHGSRDVGEVLGARRDSRGRMEVSFTLKDDDWGRYARKCIDTGVMAGLSLSHYPDTDRPVEVSLCRQGARDGTGVCVSTTTPAADKAPGSTASLNRARLGLPPLPVRASRKLMAAAAAAAAPEAPPAAAEAAPVPSTPAPAAAAAEAPEPTPSDHVLALLKDPHISKARRDALSQVLLEMGKQNESLATENAAAAATEKDMLKLLSDAMSQFLQLAGEPTDSGKVSRLIQGGDLPRMAMELGPQMVQASAALKQLRELRTRQEEVETMDNETLSEVGSVLRKHMRDGGTVGSGTGAAAAAPPRLPTNASKRPARAAGADAARPAMHLREGVDLVREANGIQSGDDQVALYLSSLQQRLQSVPRLGDQ